MRRCHLKIAGEHSRQMEKQGWRPQGQNECGMFKEQRRLEGREEGTQRKTEGRQPCWNLRPAQDSDFILSRRKLLEGRGLTSTLEGSCGCLVEG